MFNVTFSSFLGIYTGSLSCTVKLPNEVCASHTKRVGDDKTIYNSKKKFARSATQWFKVMLHETIRNDDF